MKLSPAQQKLVDVLKVDGVTLYLGMGIRLGEPVCYTSAVGGPPVRCHAGTAQAVISRGLLEVVKFDWRGNRYRLKRNV